MFSNMKIRKQKQYKIMYVTDIVESQNFSKIENRKSKIENSTASRTFLNNFYF